MAIAEKIKLDTFWNKYKARNFNSAEQKTQWTLLVLGYLIIHSPLWLVASAVDFANEQIENPTENSISKYIN